MLKLAAPDSLTESLAHVHLHAEDDHRLQDHHDDEDDEGGPKGDPGVVGVLGGAALQQLVGLPVGEAVEEAEEGREVGDDAADPHLQDDDDIYIMMQFCLCVCHEK